MIDRRRTARAGADHSSRHSYDIVLMPTDVLFDFKLLFLLYTFICVRVTRTFYAT